MQQANLDAALGESVKDLDDALRAAAACGHVQVLDVGGGDKQTVPALAQGRLERGSQVFVVEHEPDHIVSIGRRRRAARAGKQALSVDMRGRGHYIAVAQARSEEAKGKASRKVNGKNLPCD